MTSRVSRNFSRVYHVVEAADWVVRWDAESIANAVRRTSDINSVTTLSARGIANQVVHFGSRNLIMPSHVPPRIARVHPSNRVAFTWFHGDPESQDPLERRFRDLLPEAADRSEVIIASCSLGAGRLRRAGVPASKLRIIPLGVNTQLFKPASPDDRKALRAELGIPERALCIGSFQKDGEGWGRGTNPKLIKGPDVFAEVIRKIAPSYPVHILLTGPARGYIRDRLDALGIDHTHNRLTIILK